MQIILLPEKRSLARRVSMNNNSVTMPMASVILALPCNVASQMAFVPFPGD